MNTVTWAADPLLIRPTNDVKDEEHVHCILTASSLTPDFRQKVILICPKGWLSECVPVKTDRRSQS